MSKQQTLDGKEDWQIEACHGYGRPGKDGIMWVGICGGKDGALKTGYPFTKDASGKLFQRCLCRLGLSDYDENVREPEGVNCWVTNLVKGRVLKDGKNDLPTEEMKEFWWPKLKKEIIEVKPKKIIAVGIVDVGEFLERRKLSQEIKLVKVRHPRFYQSHNFEEMVKEYRAAIMM